MLTSRLPVPDLITRVIGDARRAENWSSPALTAAVANGDVRVLAHGVTVSRHYLFVQPPVIVDFERPPHDAKMHVEAKRKWCHEHDIVYVPIFLREKLTEQQFRDRYAEERQALASARTILRDDATLKRARKAAATAKKARGWTISDPEVQDLIDQETIARVTAEIRSGYNVRGSAKQRRIEAVRKDVEAEFLQRIRDGRVGHQLRYSKSAVAAGG